MSDSLGSTCGGSCCSKPKPEARRLLRVVILCCVIEGVVIAPFVFLVGVVVFGVVFFVVVPTFVCGGGVCLFLLFAFCIWHSFFLLRRWRCIFLCTRRARRTRSAAGARL